jgi:hypothetical protein
MRSLPRRLRLGLATLATLGLTSVTFAVLAPTPASAGTCYEVTVGGQTTTVCPFQ